MWPVRGRNWKTNSTFKVKFKVIFLMQCRTSHKERLQCDQWDPRCSKLCPAAGPPWRREGECTIWQKYHCKSLNNWAGFHLLLKTCVWWGSSGAPPSASLNLALSNNLSMSPFNHPLNIQCNAQPTHSDWETDISRTFSWELFWKAWAKFRVKVHISMGIGVIYVGAELTQKGGPRNWFE